MRALSFNKKIFTGTITTLLKSWKGLSAGLSKLLLYKLMCQTISRNSEIGSRKQKNKIKIKINENRRLNHKPSKWRHNCGLLLLWWWCICCWWMCCWWWRCWLESTCCCIVRLCATNGLLQRDSTAVLTVKSISLSNDTCNKITVDHSLKC